jgi:20S proteasome alpha/beta subunit
MPRWDNQDFPEEPPLSLCIAATCQWSGPSDPCVVHCCDTAGTRGDIKSEDINKIRTVGGCTVLLAGNMSHARQLLVECTPFIKEYNVGGDDIAITKLHQGLVGAVRLRKRALSTSVLSAELGVTYDEVFNWSQANPGDPTWASAWQRIRSLDMGAELIISTFTDDEAAILTIDSSGRVGWADHYAVVGTGSQLAAAFLHQREYHDFMPVDECLYRVLEAKTAAEKNPYVGKETRIVVRTAKGSYLIPIDYTEEVTRRIKKRRDEFPYLKFDLKTAWNINE